jgi:hypothetical protein
VALWLATCALLITLRWGDLANLAFRDPDDALRLVQVRDLLAGQGWFDLVQHRLYPPEGVAMHWSRLVDLPIAAMVGLLSPLLGSANTERLALVVVPLGLLAALFAITYRLVWRLQGQRCLALLALVMLLGSFKLINQFAPLRIDHHGWQILLGALAAYGLVDRHHPARGGALAGVALAAWMQVSIEGLPMTVLVGTLLAFRFATDARHWPVLRAYLASLATSLAVLQLALRGPAGFTEHWCDALALPYLAPLVTACFVTLVAAPLLGDATWPRRAALLALAGAAGLGLFWFTGQSCLAGPFAALDPLTRDLWYLRVLEGLPIERQEPALRVLILAPSLLGLITTSLAAWHATSNEARQPWLTMLWLLLCATLVSTRVARAMDLAHLLALPGMVWALGTGFRATRTLTSRPFRILLTPLLVLISPLGAVLIGFLFVAGQQRPTTNISGCTSLAGTRGLAALPAATLFTPLDIGSHLLTYTPHIMVASSHHRNKAGMALVIRTFMAEPDTARRLIATTPAGYVVMCPTSNEMRDFYAMAPGGLASVLARGRTPDWLERIPMPKSETLLVYRIRPGGS